MKHNNFPQRLEREMSNWGITQTALAVRLGVTQAAVSRWLKGEVRPRAHAAKTLADALGVRVEWLLHDGEEKLNDESRRAGEQIVRALSIPPSAQTQSQRQSQSNGQTSPISEPPESLAMLADLARGFRERAEEIDKFLRQKKFKR